MAILKFEKGTVDLDPPQEEKGRIRICLRRMRIHITVKFPITADLGSKHGSIYFIMNPKLFSVPTCTVVWSNNVTHFVSSVLWRRGESVGRGDWLWAGWSAQRQCHRPLRLTGWGQGGPRQEQGEHGLQVGAAVQQSVNQFVVILLPPVLWIQILLANEYRYR